MMNFSRELPELTKKNMSDIMQPGAKEFATEIIFKFLVVFASVAIISNLPTTLFASIKSTLSKLGGRFANMGKWIITNPLKTAGAVLTVTEATGVTDLTPDAKDLRKYIKYGAFAVGGYMLYKIFKK